VVKMLVEDGAAQKRAEDFWQQQVRDGAQLISGGGVAGDIDTKAAKLLDQTPDFRAVRGNLLGNLGAAHHDGRVLHQQAHDATEAQVSGLRLVRRGHFGPRRLPANCAGLGDAEIMRESPRNNKRTTLLGSLCKRGRRMPKRILALGGHADCSCG
jgi:hypothetical protein